MPSRYNIWYQPAPSNDFVFVRCAAAAHYNLFPYSIYSRAVIKPVVMFTPVPRGGLAHPSSTGVSIFYLFIPA